MAVEHEPERDAYTGYLTTGHEWNGIKELNTPVPRPVYFFLTLAVPVFGRLLGADAGLAARRDLHQGPARHRSAQDRRGIAEGGRDRSRRLDQARSRPASYATIQSDPKLMEIVRETGHTLFGNNCAPCHGLDAKGGPGFPNLTTQSWLWGGKPEDIFNTIRVGINSAHKDSRVLADAGVRA